MAGWKAGDSLGRDSLPPSHLLRPALPTGPGPKATTSRTSALTAPGIMIKTELRRQTQPTDMGFVLLYFVLFF